MEVKAIYTQADGKYYIDKAQNDAGGGSASKSQHLNHDSRSKKRTELGAVYDESLKNGKLTMKVL